MATLFNLRIRTSSFFAIIALVAATACGDAGGPGDVKTHIAALAGDAQFGTANADLTEPLQVVVVDAVTKQPREGIQVTWRVVTGSASVSPGSSTTDTRGIASTRLHLGAALGSATVRASTASQTNDPVTFTATSVKPPTVSAVDPAFIRSGDTVTITGSDFGTSAAAVSVMFDGIRGQLVSVANERIRVVAPACLGAHTGGVRVALGDVLSNAVAVTTISGNEEPLRLARGEVRVFTDPVAVACIRLPSDPAGTSFMLIPQNVAETYSIPMQFELAALGAGAPVVSAQAATPFATRWENALRARERALVTSTAPAAGSPIVPPASIHGSSAPVVPSLGEPRTFNTLNSSNQTVKITAEVRAVTSRAIFYQDIAAADIFTAADYQRFGELFDNTIYTTDTAVFGAVSDIDNNGRIIIVLTPSVNRLTPKGSGSFIAGYFYACDLLSKNRCSATNNGEIFYGMVPDPTGAFGEAHSAASVLRNVPPVIAHEFMHMINFSRRGTIDVLWLGEALAHTAEDIVGQVLFDDGDKTTAADFTESNHANARFYLGGISSTSLIADESPGTIELRGAGWLFLRYLRGLYGGNELLKKLTASAEYGSQNVTTQTLRTWSSLMSEFAVAIYADDAPELAGVPLEPRFTFVNMNMRELFGTGSAFPLSTHTHSFADFSVAGALPSSAWQYEYLQSPALLSDTELNLRFAGRLGGTFSTAARPQLVILRVR